MKDQRYQSYQTANISTADRGKLIVMIYDHCLKWCKLAKEAMEAKKTAESTKAIFKVQDGITELTCALDMEKGGEISKNLFGLYNFYNRHLSQAIQKSDAGPVAEVETMMRELREAWVQAIDMVRKEDRQKFNEIPNNQIKMVG